LFGRIFSMPKQYPGEIRERAVRLVAEHRGDYETEYAAIRSIAAKLASPRRSRCAKGGGEVHRDRAPCPGSGGTSDNSVDGQLAAGPRAPCRGHRGGRPARLHRRYHGDQPEQRPSWHRAAAGTQISPVYAVPGSGERT